MISSLIIRDICSITSVSLEKSIFNGRLKPSLTLCVFLEFMTGLNPALESEDAVLFTSPYTTLNSRSRPWQCTLGQGNLNYFPMASSHSSFHQALPFCASLCCSLLGWTPHECPHPKELILRRKDKQGAPTGKGCQASPCPRAHSIQVYTSGAIAKPPFP